MNEKLEKLWKKLDEEYPGFVVGDLNEWHSVDPEDEEYNGLWCSGESNSDWTNYWNEDYHACSVHENCEDEDCDGHIWDDSGKVNRKLSKLVESYGYHFEWNDAGTIMVYES